MFLRILNVIDPQPTVSGRSLLGNSMRLTYFLPILVSALTLVSAAPRAARADDSGPQYAPPGVFTPTSKQYDKRLPPVLPGEEVVTEGGQRMRVWSSSGPVPVNPRPTPQGYNGGMPGLILDGRRDPQAPGQIAR